MISSSVRHPSFSYHIRNTEPGHGTCGDLRNSASNDLTDRRRLLNRRVVRCMDYILLCCCQMRYCCQMRCCRVKYWQILTTCSFFLSRRHPDFKVCCELCSAELWVNGGGMARDWIVWARYKLRCYSLTKASAAAGSLSARSCFSWSQRDSVMGGRRVVL